MISSVIEFIKSAITDKMLNDPVWATTALVGQLIFGGRFVLQWLVSEYKKKSHVPTSFWYISLVGSIIMLVYSVHIKNPIFMLGFSLNTLIYLRNIHLIYNHAKRNEAAAMEEGGD